MQKDLYLRWGAAWNAAIWILNAIGVVLLLWATSSEADSAQTGRDYLLPSQAKGGFISIPASTESGQPSARSSSSKSLTTVYKATSRLTHVYGHGCDSQAPAPDSSGISGNWYDPSHTGEGFIFEQISTDEVLIFWFTRDETGNQFWMFDSGAIFNSKIRSPQLLQPESGHRATQAGALRCRLSSQRCARRLRVHEALAA